jgi:nitrate/nitrite-specific signal transduction histidine kinase
MPPETVSPKTMTEEAIDLVLKLRDTLNDGFNQLRELSLKLKDINRSTKASSRDFSSLRSALKSLQGVKL